MLLRRLQSRTTSLLLRHTATVRLRCYSSLTRSPLKVLFCGADEFSISSLLALYKLRRTTGDPSRFASIDVVCRPGKRVGRGLKQTRNGTRLLLTSARKILTSRQVPIKDAAELYGLPIHEIDTFTGWTVCYPSKSMKYAKRSHSLQWSST